MHAGHLILIVGGIVLLLVIAINAADRIWPSLGLLDDQPSTEDADTERIARHTGVLCDGRKQRGAPEVDLDELAARRAAVEARRWLR